MHIHQSQGACGIYLDGGLIYFLKQPIPEMIEPTD